MDWLFDPPALEGLDVYPVGKDVGPAVDPLQPQTPGDRFDWDELLKPSGAELSEPATNPGDVIITDWDDPYDEWWETWTPGGGGPPPGGGSSGSGNANGPNTSGLTGHDGLGCAANAIKADIDGKSTNNTKEHVAIVFKGADGKFYNSPAFAGQGSQVGYQELGQWMANHGVSFSDIVGLYHNHPASTSQNGDPDVYRYPSNQNSVAPGNSYDWSAAGYFVGGGTNPNTFVLLLEDQDGDVRSFSYSSMNQYNNMTVTQMAQAANLPGTTSGCG